MTKRPTTKIKTLYWEAEGGNSAMLHLLSRNIASYFSGKSIIPQDDEAVYAYGFELLFSALLNGGIVLLLAVVFGKVPEALLYVAAFILLRQTAGGYHASTNLGCTLILTVAFTGCMLLLTFLPTEYYKSLTMGAMGLSSVGIVFFGPVDSKAKPFTSMERTAFRCRSIMALVFEICVIVVMFTLFPMQDFALSLSTGMLTAALSVIVGRLFLVAEAKSQSI